MDKTGTITEGKPTVTAIIADPPLTREQLLQVAASLENLSEHSLAEALVTAAKTQNIVLDPVEEFLAVPGLAVPGRINQKRYFAGNLKFIKEKKLAVGQFEVDAVRLAEGGTRRYFSAMRLECWGLLP